MMGYIKKNIYIYAINCVIRVWDYRKGGNSENKIDKYANKIYRIYPIMI